MKRFRIGLDMQCRKIITEVEIIRMMDKDEYGRDCIIRTASGIRMPDSSANLYLTRLEAASHLSDCSL